MKNFLVILGIVILNTPAILAFDGNNVRHDSDHSVLSNSYSAERYDLDGRTGVPPKSGGASR